jgi:Reverse transcriptase (RNA-dependent DNA polymerase)
MGYLGYPEKIVRILEGIYKDTFSAVRVGGDITEWFITIVGVLQGCILSPLLLNIFLGVVLAMALDKMDKGAIIDGEVPSNLRFADDVAVLAENKNDLQNMVDRIVEASEKLACALMLIKRKYTFLEQETNSSK